MLGKRIRHSQAMEERARGDFDDYKEGEYEEFWGQKQKLHYQARAGEAQQVRLGELLNAGVLRVGQVRCEDEVSMLADVVASVADDLCLGGTDAGDGRAIIYTRLVSILCESTNGQRRRLTWVPEDDSSGHLGSHVGGQLLRRVVHELAALGVAS